MEIVTDSNEHNLLLSIAAGSEPAFTQLFDRYKNEVYAHALYFTQSITIAEEITQDVFLKCWLKKETLPEINDLRAWLFTIAKNDCFTHLKKVAREHRLKNYMAIVAEQDNENIESYMTLKEQQQLLHQAVENLPAQQKKVFVLNREGGLKNAEIAKQLNISPNTVKIHLGSALRTIRHFFKAHIERAVQVLCILHLIK